MAEEENDENKKEEGSGDGGASMNETEGNDKITPLSGLYEDWFLDYASYVILERAVPALEDGLKPVQRRILHAMKELDDGRYNKVANIIGHTMKYHPHGDASIGDALVQLGQKELVIDAQGNWGNTLTGDSAAAPRYIEARLSKFALEVVFNNKTTNWLASYDGRNKEPEYLPVKFPLLLAQGAEGIAVGMACKMLPHNFNELIDNAINHLRGKQVEILPDFLTGGAADFTNYNDGLRGGRVRVRAKVSIDDKKTLSISEIPYGTTTQSLIDSIIKANDKGKIKVKKIEDNTSDKVEILIHLPNNISPDKTVDALYAFTDCEVSISPNAAVIVDDKPVFMGVSDILRKNTDMTVDLLTKELEIRKGELQEQWHFASLERIFIEKRIYRDIEEEETWEGVLSAIDKGLHKYISTPGRKNSKKGVIKVHRDISEEDIIRLTEIKIKRISKFDSNKAEDNIQKLEDELADVQKNLDNIIDYTVDYFKALKEKYGKDFPRRTEISVFENISAKKVVVKNKKLYVDKKEGFIGLSQRGLANPEYVQDCSDIDDIIVFNRDGTMQVTRIDDKKFIKKDIIYAGVWKKGDSRTIYHLVYRDGKTGPAMVKRFAVKSIRRDNEYQLTPGNKGTKVLYFSMNPNGRQEIVHVLLKASTSARNRSFDFDFAELLIKGRGAKGNILSKHPVSKITQKETGGSTLAARKIWWDDVVKRLNSDGRGKLLGKFKGDDKILTIYENGEYRLSGFELTTKFDDDLIKIEKWHPDHDISAVYYDGERELHYVKRFECEVTTDKRVSFISEHEKSHLDAVSTAFHPVVKIVYSKRYKHTKNRPPDKEDLHEFIDVKGLKAQGNQLTKLPVKDISIVEEEDWPDQDDSDQDDGGNDGGGNDDGGDDGSTPSDNGEDKPAEDSGQDDQGSKEEKEEEKKKEKKGKKSSKPKKKSGKKSSSSGNKAKSESSKKNDTAKAEEEGPVTVEWDVDPEEDEGKSKKKTAAKQKKKTSSKKDTSDDAQPSLFD